MSIAILHQVFDETRRLSIAGSNLAEEDFRLKKLIAPLEKSGAKAPVFAKVAQAAQRLLDAKPKESAQALLDLSSLVLAILYTQGEIGGKGKLKPVKTVGISLTGTQTPARLIKPVIEALTTTGSGRLETIREAHQRGAFKDPRLVNYALEGLNDVYSELADFVETKILPNYGTAIIPLLANKIDISGRAGNARRLKLLHVLDPKLARPMVLEAFEKGSKEMKLAGLACMGSDKADLDPILEQASARSMEIRHVALERLLLFKDKSAIDRLLDAIQNEDGGHIAYRFRERANAALLKRMIEVWNSEFQLLIQRDTKTPRKPADKKELERLLRVLDNICTSMPFKADKAISGMASKVLDSMESLPKYRSGYRDGGDILSWASGWIARCGSKPLKQRLASLRDDIPMISYDDCLLAAMQTMTPQAFYDEHHLLIDIGSTKNKKTLEKVAKSKRRTQSDIKECAHTLESCLEDQAPTKIWHDFFDDDDDYDYDMDVDYPDQKPLPLDPRWLQDAIDRDDADFVLTMCTAKDKKAIDYLCSVVEEAIKQKKADEYDIMMTLKRIVMCKAKSSFELTQKLIQSISDKRAKGKKPRWGYSSMYWISQALPYLSAADCKKLQVSLEGMHESVVDEVLVYIAGAAELRKKKRK